MFDSLSDIQRTIVFDKSGKSVVRACPGSGKTYSVAARLAYRMQHWQKRNAGIAAISFTNVAWEEIAGKLSENFGVRQVVYPHFLGTIDSFINNYIFMPHGHLVMGCGKRPVMVGEPHGRWPIKRYEKDYDQYFDIVSYGRQDELIYPEIQGYFFFGFNKIFKQDGTESAHAEHLREMKQKYWRVGYATQHDANYIALRLLEKFPHIAKGITHRFCEIILDEAQDTNEVQMRILEILCEQGLCEVLLVGDPDQAIFEWNKAKPQLFHSKFEEWRENSVVLNENRRSSTRICNATFHLSTLENCSEAVNDDVKESVHDPEVLVFDDENVQDTINVFLAKCRECGIPIEPDKVAIVCRSKGFIDGILGNPPVSNLIWTQDNRITYPLLHAAFLMSKGHVKRAYKVLETMWIKKSMGRDIIAKTDIDHYIEQKGFIVHRSDLFSIFNRLPSATGALGNWINTANIALRDLNIQLICMEEAKDIQIETLFSLAEAELDILDFTVGTVHSVKGETFDAVLLFLKTRGIGRNYTTMIRDEIPSNEEEELRIVYVGITRPRVLLMIAVPNEENRASWRKKLRLE